MTGSNDTICGTKPTKLDIVLQICGAAALTVLFLLPFLLLRVSSYEEFAPSDTQEAYRLPPLVAVPPLETAFRDTATGNIHAWMELENPELMLAPNEKLGFTAFAKPLSRIKPQMPDFSQQRLVPENSQLLQAIITKHPYLPESMQVSWQPNLAVDIPAAPARDKATGILWRSLDGRRVTTPPEIDSAAAQIAYSESPASFPTRLETAPPVSSNTPRIIIRKSCGNRSLDTMAADALRRYLHSKSSDGSQYAGFTLEILWKLD